MQMKKKNQYQESEALIGRQEIADYAKVSTWTVTCMIKQGLKVYGTKRVPRCLKDSVDCFYLENQEFSTRKFYKRPKVLKSQ